MNESKVFEQVVFPRLERLSGEKRSLIACRASLRVLPFFVVFKKQPTDRVILASFRAALVTLAFGCGSANKTEISKLQNAALLAASSKGFGNFFSGALGNFTEISARTVAFPHVPFYVSRAIDATFWFCERVFLNGEAAAKDLSTEVSSDIHLNEEKILSNPLWGPELAPHQFSEWLEKWIAYLSADAKWSFWHRWHLEMWNGTFRDWDLAVQVALIPNEVWEGDDAVAKVAHAIREIEARQGDHFDRPDSVPEIKQQKLLEHVQRLLASPDMTALAAEGAADTLERAIAQYLKDAPANCLPDALAHLEGVPPLFRRIAATVKSVERGDAKAAKLADDIEVLNAKIARLESDLRDARAKTVHGLFTQNALKAAGTAFGAGLVGSLGLAVSHFFAEWPSDLTLENFRGWTSDLGTAEPKPEAATLPPSDET
ncbi:hypothetical protein [uncultured Tateyamaria sp.]|uniref:hypothetical protein n=1 Tax=uncultured Tateyamaria sp. TaxID=455651 RepID=UPI002606337D|nr:hypothetical protein [uncultured Tateyamaria sp.]